MKKGRNAGFSFIEMLVSLTVIAILAGVALPFAELGWKRAKEAELRQALRSTRQAIDAFHQDCRNDEIAQGQAGVSQDCYPDELNVLIDGVSSSAADSKVYRYLRRLPADPFSDEDDRESHWIVRGYRDEPDGIWSGDDVFDIRVDNDGQAIDGTYYQDW